MSKPLKVGIISANWGMLAHLPAWHALENVQVAAVCTSRRETAEAAAQANGIGKAYWDHAEMAADADIDIIDCGTRPDLRYAMVMTAIGNGKHVYASANFAASHDAAREMRDAAQAAGVVGALDSCLGYTPAHMRAKEMIAEGYLGQPVSVSTRFNISLFNGPNPAGDYWRWFAKLAHGASAPRNLGTHSLHLLIDLLGPVEAVVAQGKIGLTEWRFADGEMIVPETEDSGQMLIRFENGVLGTVSTSWASPALVGWQMELTGTKGTIVSRYSGFFPAGPEVELLAGKDGAPLEVIDLPDRLIRPQNLHFINEPPVAQSYDIAGVMGSMTRAIREGGEPSPNFAQACHVEAILEAVRISSRDQRWVLLDELHR